MFRNFYALLFIVLLASPLILSSCSSNSTDEAVVVDTVIVKVDTVKVDRKVKEADVNLTVQIGAFANKNNADDFARIARQKLSGVVEVTLASGKLYKITVGRFNDPKKASDYLQIVKSKGYSDSFVSSR